MLSRERVLMALNHQEPDRVPMDFGGTSFTGIQVTAYDRLKKLLGIETPSTITNKRAQLVAVEEVIKKRLHADVDGIGLNPPASLPQRRRSAGQYFGGRVGCALAFRCEGGTYCHESAFGRDGDRGRGRSLFLAGYG